MTWLAVDVGNTSIACGIFDGKTLRSQFRIDTDSTRSVVDYVQEFQRKLAQQQPSCMVACSVVPMLEPMLQQLAMAVSVDFFSVGNNFDVPLNIDVDTPAEVGADRLVAAYAAYQSAPQRPHIVIDFGTATTFDVVQASGTYSGGVIAPGVNLSLAALEQAAAKLPHIPVAAPPSIIGKNTVHAMQSGLYYGYLSMVEGVILRLKETVGDDVCVTATGGLAALYAPACAPIHQHDDNLMMTGLSLLAEHYSLTESE